MKQEEFDREIWTTRNVADYYGCTPQAVYDMRDAGKLHQLVNLPGVRFSKREVVELAKMPGDSLLPHEVALLKRELKLEKEKNERLMALMFKVGQLGSQAMAEILKGGENNELEI
jgi:hypothetical protein